MRRWALTMAVFAGLLALAQTFAQRGDKAGEEQAALPEAWRLPATPALSPQEAIKSFSLPEGFRIELVATEPLIQAPVAMQFDEDGRLWVVQMPGYMPHPDGKGEDAPNGRISILTDTDGDGRMDSGEVFLDGLVLPRAISLVKGGVLVAEPPKLWFVPRVNGKAGPRVLVDDRYAVGGNVEHQPNGLLYGLDNWLYNAKSDRRHRQVGDKWVMETTEFRGQWGITQDDLGRLYHNSNSDQLRCDLVPPNLMGRNPNHPSSSGLNVQIAASQRVFPIRLTPGVNRGYQKNTLTEQGKLRAFTGACGPLIYRGHGFPAEFYSNGFVAEPCGNLVKRNIVSDQDGKASSRFAYDDREFLASTDERFRPVNLHDGPDGALYVVDMYRGIIQHKTYMTSFLRKQVEARKLTTPLDMGRIYRVVHEKAPATPRPAMSGQSGRELVAHLSHPNAWWRLTAQRLLVQRGADQTEGELAKLAADESKPLGRIHALWTLEGLGALSGKQLELAGASKDDSVATTAARLAGLPIERIEGWKESDRARWLAGLASHASRRVRLQIAFWLGPAGDHPQAFEAMAKLLADHPGDPLFRDALLSGLTGRELKLLKSIATSTTADPAMLGALAAAVMRSRNLPEIQQAIALAGAAELSAEKQRAILGAMAGVAGGKNFKPINPGNPGSNGNSANPSTEQAPHMAMLAKLKQSTDKSTSQSATLLDQYFLGKLPGAASRVELNEAQKKQFEAGRIHYLTVCMGCHQLNGKGLLPVSPPLADSEWVEGSPERLVRITLHGMQGPVKVAGKLYKEPEIAPVMPGLKDNPLLDDQKIADILTYIRNEWGNNGAAISAQTVAKIRAKTASRVQPWTQEELLKIK